MFLVFSLAFAGHDVEDLLVGGTHGVGTDDGKVADAAVHVVVNDALGAGDVNHDGAVNVKDVTDLIDYLLDIDNGICTICADVKEDNAINIADVTYLIDMILGVQTTE